MKYYVYIRTDNNRREIDIHYTRRDAGGDPTVNRSTPETSRRIVYQEVHENELSAFQRVCELKSFTRMQLERLVRRSNPNWVNLAPAPRLSRVRHPLLAASNDVRAY